MLENWMRGTLRIMLLLYEGLWGMRFPRCALVSLDRPESLNLNRLRLDFDHALSVEAFELFINPQHFVLQNSVQEFQSSQPCLIVIACVFRLPLQESVRIFMINAEFLKFFEYTRIAYYHHRLNT